jgi:hypothetical protein
VQCDPHSDIYGAIAAPKNPTLFRFVNPLDNRRLFGLRRARGILDRFLSAALAKTS